MSATTDKKYTSTVSLVPFLKRLFGLAKDQYPKYFWFLVFSVSIVSIADAYFPFLWGYYIDEVLVPNISSTSNQFTIQSINHLFKNITLLFIFWVVVMAIGVMSFIWCASMLRELLIFNLREQMFNKLQHLSFSFFDTNSSGWLVTRITSDTNRVAELISWGFVSFVWGVIMVVSSFAFMFYLNINLSFAVFISIPILLYVSTKIRLFILKYSRKSRKQNSEMIAYVTEHINGVPVNKATGQEHNSIASYSEQTKKMMQYSYKSAFYTAMYMPLVFLTGSVAAIAVILLGGNLYITTSAFSLGLWAMFFGYTRSIFEPIFDISRFYAMAQDSLSAGERIFGLIDEKPSINDNKSKGEFNSIRGDIVFKKVHFSYNVKKQILKDFNLQIKAGQSVALVGPTGHGKTTISALIARFYEPLRGSLLIDGIDYRERSLKSYRSQLGIILQNPFLFSGTVKDNILYGLRGQEKTEISDQDLRKYLKSLGANILIDKLYKEVGETGKMISNGERQLVSIARALIKDPAIIIMDEATSSVDTISEIQIQKSIQYIIKNRTSIIIAHRLSTIRNCDNILVIENGAIKEQGTHDGLVKIQKGHYATLYKKLALKKSYNAKR